MHVIKKRKKKVKVWTRFELVLVMDDLTFSKKGNAAYMTSKNKKIDLIFKNGGSTSYRLGNFCVIHYYENI